MQPEQKIIAAWMRRVCSKRGWSGEEWSKRANVSPTTVTRAQGDDFKSVTSVLTLDRLARAAGVPSVLDYLQAEHALIAPSEDIAVALMTGVMHGIDRLDQPLDREQTSRAMVYGLFAGLRLIGRNPAIADNTDAARALGEAMVLPEQRQQSVP